MLPSYCTVYCMVQKAVEFEIPLTATKFYNNKKNNNKKQKPTVHLNIEPTCRYQVDINFGEETKDTPYRVSF